MNAPASRARLRVALLAALTLASPAASAEERRIPFWPDAVPRAIHDQIDGAAALATVRELGRFHRVHGSPGFAAAAEHVRQQLEAAHLSEVAVEHFPADGKTKYAHFRSYYGWNAQAARLEEVAPEPRLLKEFPRQPVALADYSNDADVTAELVDVGAGTDARDYAGKDVRGRLVLADGPLARVHQLAVEERGAAGILSDFPNQTTAWSGVDVDLVRWGHLSPYVEHNRFAFMLSRREAAALRARLGREPIRLHAVVRAHMTPASYDVVSAVLPGRDPAAGEIVLTAHLCHQSAGANDNASGSAAILEIARALSRAVAAGSLPAPRRSIRFLWLPEIAGSQAWLVSHPELVRRLRAGIHMDMVGGLLGTTHGTLHVSRSAESLPHVAGEIARAFFDEVAAASAAYAERGGDARAGFAWPGGSREALLGDLRALELGSDHEVFEEASFAVPMVYFHDWPDVTIHTNKDVPENLDATKLGRVAYLGAGIAWTLAALPDGEVGRLERYADLGAATALVDAERRALGWLPDDARLAEREARAEAAVVRRSIAALWPAAAHTPAPRTAEARTGNGRARDARVPVRSPEVRGPVSVYYYDHLAETLGPGERAEPALAQRQGGVLAYELLNFVDGHRSVAELRDLLTGRYEPVPLAEVAEYLELLARARVITWAKGK